MNMSAMLQPNAVSLRAEASCKKQALEIVSALGAQVTELSERKLFDTLLERERLGSTAIGGGVAIPHGSFDGLSEVKALFIGLESPVDFEAPDGKKIDMMFVLLAPGEEAAGAHLQALSRIARLLKDEFLCDKLRQSAAPEVVYQLLIEGDSI